MKHGFLFFLVACVLGVGASRGGPWLILLWPALSFAIVSVGYLRVGPRVFGKRPNGLLSPITIVALAPFLAFTWILWRLVCFVGRESPVNRLTENVYIGRRLTAYELPVDVSHVVDLTCEFNEPAALRSKSYRSLPILDGEAPPLEILEQWTAAVVKLSGAVFIHCAMGHGRTGLFAAALLLRQGESLSAHDALARVQGVRPGVRLNRRQMATLRAFADKSSRARSKSDLAIQ